jgi:hypothetical protein
MKKVLLMVSTLVLVIGSVTITALADNSDNPAACAAATGFPTDVCATCSTKSAATGDSGDAATCACKMYAAEDPAGYAAEFPNQGACIKIAHSLGY